MAVIKFLLKLKTGKTISYVSTNCSISFWVSEPANFLQGIYGIYWIEFLEIGFVAFHNFTTSGNCMYSDVCSDACSDVCLEIWILWCFCEFFFFAFWWINFETIFLQYLFYSTVYIYCLHTGLHMAYLSGFFSSTHVEIS